MRFLDKVKNMFIEEYDDDEIKKEVIQVKIPTPERKKEEKVVHEYEPNPKYDEDYERPAATRMQREEPEKVVEKKAEETKEIAKNPVPKYFDDSDFEMFNERKNPDIVKQEYKYTRTETVIKPSGSPYGIKKEELKKNFTPTPIISPVYGVLDKNYKKEEISSKKKTSTIYDQFEKIDVDDIRKKAFGTLEDDLENNLSRDAIVFNDDIDAKMDDDKEITEYEEQPLDIFNELEKKDALDDLLGNYNLKEDEESIDEPVDDNESLVEDELNRDYDNYEEELNESYKDDLNDSDLFNLIDSMYPKKDGE